jgi:hypothetical protein
MVRPLARSGRCGASALAGTVAGMVTIQNAPNPNATTLTASIANRRMKIVRSIGGDVSAQIESVA